MQSDRENFKWTKSYECRSELGWMTLDEGRRRMLTCCQLYKIVNNLACSHAAKIVNNLDCLSFNDYFTFNHSVTRSHRLNVNYLSSRVHAFRYSFFVNSPFLWNALPLDIAQSRSYCSFKKSLKLSYRR